MIKMLILSVFLMGCMDVAASKPGKTIPKSFEIYHDISWQNLPDDFPLASLPDFNLAPNSGVYWAEGANKFTDDPSEAATKAYVMTFAYGETRYLNIEHLPNRYDLSTVEDQLDTVRKLSMILHWAKTQRPDIEMGIFAMTVEKHFNPLLVSPPEYIERNKRFSSLSNYADVIYLEMYTWWEDRHDKWSEALVSSVFQANLTGKKVIVFVWPHYQQTGALMPGDEWRKQLEEMYLIGVAGIVIWDKKTCDWLDPNCADETDSDNWWYQTLDFIDSKGV